MPWRSRPRAAVVTNVMWMTALVVLVSLLCVPLLQLPAEVRETFNCVSVRGDRWSLLPGLEYTGRLRVQVPAGRDAGVTLVVGDSLPLAVEAESIAGMPVPLDRDIVNPMHAPIDFWFESGSPWLAPEHILKATLTALEDRAQTVVVTLGRRAPRVLARLTGFSDGARARICAAPVAAPSAFAGARSLEIGPAQSAYFAGGWYGLEVRPPLGIVRWMSDHGAVIVPSSRDGAVRARLRALHPAGGEGELGSVTLTVNDVFEAAPVAMKPGAASYDWMIPNAAWLAGTNELLFSVSQTYEAADRPDRRAFGLALQKLTLTLVDETSHTSTK